MLSKLCCGLKSAGLNQIPGEDDTFLPPRIITKKTTRPSKSLNPKRRRKQDLTNPDRFVITPYVDRTYNTAYMWADATDSSGDGLSSDDGSGGSSDYEMEGKVRLMDNTGSLAPIR